MTLLLWLLLRGGTSTALSCGGRFRFCYFLLVVVAAAAIVLAQHPSAGLASASSYSAAAAAPRGKNAARMPPGTIPDPFVQAAPLVVAMACRDGVAIVAVAGSAPGSANPSELLLLFDEEQEESSTGGGVGVGELAETNKDDGGKKDKDVDDDDNMPFLDLPLSSYDADAATLLRIQSVAGTAGTALVTCGWRADGGGGGGRLGRHARDVTRAERRTFGGVESGDGCGNAILPSRLSLYMARCAVSDRIRALSCAALVASPSSYGGGSGSGESRGAQNDASPRPATPGCLWLVDATGSYPVRALCLGGGVMTTTKAAANADVGGAGLVADAVNRKLLALARKEHEPGKMEQRRPYFDRTAAEGLETLLSLLGNVDDIGGGSANDDGDGDTAPPIPRPPLVPGGTRLELAVVDSSRRGIVRHRVRDVWGRVRQAKSMAAGGIGL